MTARTLFFHFKTAWHHRQVLRRGGFKTKLRPIHGVRLHFIWELDYDPPKEEVE